jgi:caa(3)-type oxidase subunit IV
MASAVSDSVNKHPVRRLLLTLVALLALAGLSWGLSYASLGLAAAPVALSIAFVKALCIALVFMELAEGTTVARGALSIAAAFILLLCGIVLADVLLR